MQPVLSRLNLIIGLYSIKIILLFYSAILFANPHEITLAFDIPTEFGSGRFQIQIDTAQQSVKNSTITGQFTLETNQWLKVATGKFHFNQPKIAHWQLDLTDLTLKTGQHHWQQQALTILADFSNDIPQFQGNIPNLSLDGWLPWLKETIKKLSPAWQKKLKSLKIQGNLKNLAWQYTSPSDWQLKTDFQQLKIEQWQTVPKIQKLSGQLEISPKQGKIQFDTSKLTIDHTKFYTHSLNFTKLRGSLRWQRHAKKWQISTSQLQFFDQKMKFQIKGKLDLPISDGIPTTDIQIVLSKGQLSQLNSYTPDKLLRGYSKWSNQAIIAGNLVKAEAIFKGPINQLFDKKHGRFKLSALIKQVNLNYAKGYPGIHHAHMKVVMKGKHLTVKVSTGQILKSEIRNVVIDIADISQATVKVFGTVNGNAESGLDFVQQSPLHKTVKLKDLQLEGPMQIYLNLLIPLKSSKSGKKQVKGKITFKNNLLRNKSLNITITNVAGIVQFTENELMAKSMTGKLFTYPISFSIQSANHKPKRTQVKIEGSANHLFLNQQLSQLNPKFADLSIYKHFNGNMAWQALIELTEMSHNTKQIKVSVNTDFYGMGIKLPAPFGKEIHTNAPFQLTAVLNNKQPNILRFNYNEVINGVFQINQAGLEKGAIILGATEATLPTRSGLTMQGYLSEFSVEEWLTYFSSQSSSNNLQPHRSSKPRFLSTLNIHVNQLKMFGQRFKKVNLQAKHVKNQWQLSLSGNDIDGYLLYDDKKKSLNFVFDRLKLKKPESVQKSPKVLLTSSSINPRNLPKINFYCRALHYEKLDLGTINVYTAPHEKGLLIDLLEVKNPELSIQIRGKWENNHFGDRTTIQANLKSADIAKMLKRFGHKESPIIDSSAKVILDASWQNTPYNFSLKQLMGSLRLLITEGQVVDVDPGLGRVLGLFDLQILPQRLALDFSDIFNVGFKFSTITGSFDIRKGHAYTDNLILQGRAAHIKISGRTGLVTQDYDQLITVIPHVSNALPVASAIAGGLGIGAIALLVQKMLEKEIEELINYQYLLTGSWEKSKIDAKN